MMTVLGFQRLTTSEVCNVVRWHEPVGYYQVAENLIQSRVLNDGDKCPLGLAFRGSGTVMVRRFSVLWLSRRVGIF